jgi:hypothetical protein
MSGSFDAVLGPAALRFFRPILVVGGGGGSYLGFSFWRRRLCQLLDSRRPKACQRRRLTFLSLSSLPSPPGPPPMFDCWLPCFQGMLAWLERDKATKALMTKAL